MLEQHKGLPTRVVTLLLAVLGVYPQYKAVQTMLVGRGWLAGAWEEEHQINREKLNFIEPVIESLIQVSYIQNY